MSALLSLLLLAGAAAPAQAETQPPAERPAEDAVAESIQQPVTDPTPSAAAAAQLPEGVAPLVPLDELDARAAADPARPVTVLLPLARADVVASAATVERTFARDQVQLDPVSSSRAVFVSGGAAVVAEAVKRLRQLDDVTPEAPVRPRRNPAQQPEDRPVLDDYAPDTDSLRSGVGFLIAGVIGLVLAAILLVRRMTA